MKSVYKLYTPTINHDLQKKEEKKHLKKRELSQHEKCVVIEREKFFNM